MAFIINQNFDLKAGVKDFERQNLVLEPTDASNSLKNAPESWFPNDYTVTIGGVIYVFNSANEVDETTGKWRKLDIGKQGALDKTSVGLGNVDNTADADKPVSKAQQAAIDAVKTTADAANTAAGEAKEIATAAAGRAAEAKDTADAAKTAADGAATNATNALTQAENAANAAEGASQAAIEAKASADAATAEVNSLKGTLGSAYRSKGSKDTFADVQALTDAKVGDVWNVNAAFTLDGKKYAAGTNVVCTAAATTGENAKAAEWDALGGTFDTSSLENSITENRNDIAQLQSDVSGLTVTLSVAEI